MTARPDRSGRTEEGARPSLAPEAPDEPIYDWRLLTRLVPFLKPQASLLIAAALFIPLTSWVSVAQPYLLKLGIDAIVVQQSPAALLDVTLWFAAALGTEFLFRFGQIYLMQLAGQRSMAQLRRTVYQHIQRLNFRYFDRTPVGRIVTRVTNDVDALSELFASGAVTAIADIVTLVAIIGFMLFLDWRLSLVAFVSFPPLALVVNAFRRRARTAFRQIRARVAQLNAYLAEQVNGMATIQAFGREARCAAEYDEINTAYRDANYRAIRFDALLYSVVESISVVTVGLVLWYASVRAGLLEADGAAAAYVGTVVAFYDYIQRFFVPVRDLATKYTIVQSSLASAERIFGLLDVQEFDAPALPAEDQSELPARPDEEGIVFDRVTFGYRPGLPVLESVDLTLRPGETTAVVGATGSGKTTLTSLLLRFYELNEGSIRIEGRDIRAQERTALRRQFAILQQDVFLFSGTVFENVTLGAPDPDEERARDVLERVGAWDLLQRRPGGMHAPVDERGTNFSAGERQLIAFARALYRNPPYLILDEATALVDSETEARLQRAVQTLLAGRTSLVIAHRLSTIRRAHRIVVLHHGRVTETGTHDELLSEEGVYARLYQLQLSA